MTMKTTQLYFFICLLLFVSVNSKAGAPKGAPIFSLEKKYHDFGTITEGEVVTTVFVFTNTGDGPLIISDIITPCGCTVPEWPKEPILPGEQKEIKVEFNSKGKSGIQRKMLRVISNASGENVLQIKLNVIPS